MVPSLAPAPAHRCFPMTPSFPSQFPFLFSLPSTGTTTSRALLSFVARAEPEVGTGQGSADEPSSGDNPTKAGARKGVGFGAAGEKKRKKGGEKRKVIRRSPIERPSVFYQRDGGKGGDGSGGEQREPDANENAFLLTWLGLGSVILVEGIALAASGFLPEEWDKFFVKYLYPSFTPTVGLFIGGTVVYGVVKYLQGERMKNGN